MGAFDALTHALDRVLSVEDPFCTLTGNVELVYPQNTKILENKQHHVVFKTKDLNRK